MLLVSKLMKKTILIVDDSELITYTVQDGLEHLNPEYSVIPIGSGIQCLEYLRNNQLPDIIILDIIMPDMNGWEVYKALRQNPQWTKIPIIFLTARTDAYNKGLGKILGDAYIEKPFDMNFLKKEIETILSHTYEISPINMKDMDQIIEKIKQKKRI